MAVGWQLLITGLLAASVGLTELLTRYRSDPGYPLRHSVAAWFYVGLNAAAGVGALLLVRAFGWTFGQTHNIELWRILVAGFGAVALFRSSLFVTKIGGTEVGVGPSLVLGALLETFDREVDRKCAEEMSKVIDTSVLAGLDPERVMSTLPVLCLALMQNFPASDQALLAADLNKTRSDTTLSPQAKMRAVTIQLAKYLSPQLVKRLLQAAREVLVEPSAEPTTTVLAEAKKLTAPEVPGEDNH
jgi:hypothetical protein